MQPRGTSLSAGMVCVHMMSDDHLGDELDGIVIAAAHKRPQLGKDAANRLRHSHKDGAPVRTPREVAILRRRRESLGCGWRDTWREMWRDMWRENAKSITLDERVALPTLATCSRYSLPTLAPRQHCRAFTARRHNPPDSRSTHLHAERCTARPVRKSKRVCPHVHDRCRPERGRAQGLALGDDALVRVHDLAAHLLRRTVRHPVRKHERVALTVDETLEGDCIPLRAVKGCDVGNGDAALGVTPAGLEVKRLLRSRRVAVVRLEEGARLELRDGCCHWRQSPRESAAREGTSRDPRGAEWRGVDDG